MEELEVMRQQLAVLKDKLEKETIVSDKLLREVTRQKVRRLNRNVWQQGFCTAFILVCGYWIFGNILGSSLWFIIFTDIYMVVCFLGTLIPHLRVQKKDIMSGNLLQVAKEIRSLKQYYKNWMSYAAIPLILTWLGLFFLDQYWTNHTHEEMYILLISVLFGYVIGGTFGYIQHKKLLREMDDIIAQIEDTDPNK